MSTLIKKSSINQLLTKLNRNAAKWKHANGGTILKMQLAGKMPGTRSQYNNVTQIYQALVDKGVTPQAALDLTNQKVAEKGWTGFVTGDNKKYPNAQSFADHLINWHSRMYPDSLKAQNFQQYYDGIQKMLSTCITLKKAIMVTEKIYYLQDLE